MDTIFRIEALQKNRSYFTGLSHDFRHFRSALRESLISDKFGHKTCVIATMREITTALIPVLKTRSTIRQIGQYNADYLRYGLRQTSVSHHT